MRFTATKHLNQPLQLVGILLALGLGGCTSEPVKQPEPPPPKVELPKPVEPVRTSLSLPSSAYSDQFRRADDLLNNNQWMAASEIIETIPIAEASSTDRVYLAYLQARIDYLRGKTDQALAQLNSLDYQGMNDGQRYRALNLKRHILEMRGDYLESARLGDQVLRMAISANTEVAPLKRQIWRDLQRVATAQLEQAAAAASDSIWQDWLELALLTRAPLTAQMQSLPLWLQSHASHPAAKPLPGGLAYLLGTPQTPQTVALILPLSGRLAPAGRAVRDGYLASYYQAVKNGAPSYDLLVLDQDSYGSAGVAYDVALSKGATMVVGPLSKDAVAELGSRADRSVPVLALNRLDSSEAIVQSSSALVQFALSPEDEAGNIAELAFGQGARSALVIRPQGDWGSKVAEALFKRWQSLGGTIANSVTYSGREDYSSSVKTALGIPASEQRAQAVRDLLATDVEFNARRRQDIDVVFLLSENGSQARSLKPLLAFHYAGSVPVYAISSVYSGVPDPRDRDLDGINFVETPWLVDNESALKATIASGKKGTDGYTRLNALGADAFLVQSQFRQLQAGADALLRGNTGLLSMNPQLQIQRELKLSTFDGGAIEPR